MGRGRSEDEASPVPVDASSRRVCIRRYLGYALVGAEATCRLERQLACHHAWWFRVRLDWHHISSDVFVRDASAVEDGQTGYAQQVTPTTQPSGLSQ